MGAPFTLAWASERHLRVETERALVRAALGALDRAAIDSLIDAAPAFATVLLHFDGVTLEPARAERQVRAALVDIEVAPPPPQRRVEIPACFEAQCAPDLAGVAASHGLTPGEVVAMFVGAEFEVAFIGFSPGFPYLAGLPPRLATPRLDSPRPRVARGSIGIAGEQAGIYPSPTPGGWRLIGRTPLRLFDAAREPAALLAIGDRVRFVPISFDSFRRAGGSE